MDLYMNITCISLDLVKKRLKEKLGEGPESRSNTLLNMRASLKISELSYYLMFYPTYLVSALS
jgi:hypothetical protein